MSSSHLQIDFWDVGQADCSIITLPDGRLIIIDVGRKRSPLIDWLNDRRPCCPTIAAIILTHNHADHAGALCSIVAEHKQKIEAVWMLADRDASDLRETELFRCVEQAAKQGFFRIQRVEAGHEIWRDPGSRLLLRVIHPSFIENVSSVTPNATSGLLVLEDGDDVLVAWPGDLGVRLVSDKCASRRPSVLFGPHHGGPQDIKLRKHEATAAIESLRPSRAFLSVGTGNSYSHPRPRYVQTLGRVGCHVVCSELTQRCDMGRIERREPVLQGAAILGLRPPRSGVACRGAWRLVYKNGRLIPDRFDEIHLERISHLRRPQCLFGRGWRRGQQLPKAVTPS